MFFKNFSFVPKNWFSIGVFAYWFFLTMLLLFPDPRALLWGWEPSEGPMGYAHLMTFGLLAFLVTFGRQKRTLFFWGVILFGYVYATEILQAVMPFGRQFDWADIGQDITGLLLGGGLGSFARR